MQFYALCVCVSRTNKQLQLSFSYALRFVVLLDRLVFRLYRSTTFVLSHTLLCVYIYIICVCIKYYIISLAHWLCTLTTCSSFGFVNILLTSIVYLHIRRNKQTARKKMCPLSVYSSALSLTVPVFQSLTLYLWEHCERYVGVSCVSVCRAADSTWHIYLWTHQIAID